MGVCRSGFLRVDVLSAGGGHVAAAQVVTDFANKAITRRHTARVPYIPLTQYVNFEVREQLLLLIHVPPVLGEA